MSRSQVDNMLVTETWEAMEYLHVEPPTKTLLAMFLGYTANHTSNKTPGNNPSETEIASTVGKFVKEKKPMPEWMRSSPTMQKLYASMREEKGQPHAS
jgi:hypothetical protein